MTALSSQSHKYLTRLKGPYSAPNPVESRARSRPNLATHLILARPKRAIEVDNGDAGSLYHKNSRYSHLDDTIIVCWK